MNYDDVVGMVPTRYWRVRESSTISEVWDLTGGDLLVFLGSSESGSIARVRPVPDPERLDTMNDWGLECRFSPSPNSDTEGIVKGTHNGHAFTITITAGSPRATQRGDLVGASFLDGSWMADEGP